MIKAIDEFLSFSHQCLCNHQNSEEIKIMISLSLSSSSSSSTLFFESVDLSRSRSSSSSSIAPSSKISCCSRNYSNIPKLEDFSRSDISRWLKEPSLIEKTKNELTDYCTTLEGDSCSNCWRAYFEMKDLEKEMSKEDVERIIVNSRGMKSLIYWIHSMSMIFKDKINQQKIEESSLKITEEKEEEEEEKEHKHQHIPDGLPKTRQEIEEEEEENAKLPESSFTRLLKTIGGFPAWYISRPDHETD